MIALQLEPPRYILVRAGGVERCEARKGGGMWWTEDLEFWKAIR